MATKYGEQIAAIAERTTNILLQLKDLNESQAKQWDAINANTKAIGITLDRSDRTIKEFNDHCKDTGAHGGAVAEVETRGKVTVALIGLLAGISGGIISQIPTLLSHFF